MSQSTARFSASVKKILCMRSGGKCCKCRELTIWAHPTNQEKCILIGEAAHITAAAKDGPRYDEKMSQAERKSAKNGIWLCRNCHKVVDDDKKTFTVDELRKMKKEAEECVKKSIRLFLDDDHEKVDPNLLIAVSATTIVKIREAKFLLLNTNAEEKQKVEKILESLHFINLQIDQYCHEVGTELIKFFSLLANYCNKDDEINLEVIRQFQFAMETFGSKWSENEVRLVTSTINTIVTSFPKGTLVYTSAVAFLKNMSTNKSLKKREIPLRLLKSIESVKNDEHLPTPPVTGGGEESLIIKLVEKCMPVIDGNKIDEGCKALEEQWKIEEMLGDEYDII